MFSDVKSHRIFSGLTGETLVASKVADNKLQITRNTVELDLTDCSV